MLTATKEWFNQLAVSTGVSAVIGGTVAEIHGGNFWTGASDAAIWGAAGYIVSSILNTDDGQNPADTLGFKIKKRLLGWLTGSDWTNDAVNEGWKEAGKGAVEGSKHGLEIIGNSYTFGLTDKNRIDKCQ